MLTVATCSRGRRALDGVDGISVVPPGAPEAKVLWHRAGLDALAAVERMPELRWLHADSAGVDHLPLAKLAARGVVVTKTAAYTEAVAEWIITAVCVAAKDVPAYLRASDARRWESAIGTPRLVSRSRAVIVGAGEIGVHTATILRSMGVGVELVSRTRNRDRWPNDLLPDADWLILACPLTDETQGLIDTAELAALKDGAWVVNVARGQVIKEEALTAALDTGRLAGAVLDAFAVEPLPVNSLLWGRPNVIVLPHDTWRAAGAGRRQVSDFLAQLDRYRAGLPLLRTVNPDAGY